MEENGGSCFLWDRDVGGIGWSKRVENDLIVFLF